MKQMLDTDLRSWKPLFRISGILIAIMAVLIPLQVVIFAVSFPPDTVTGWFELYRENWILGLLHMDFLYIIDNVIVAVLYLAYYLTLKQKNESLMLIAIMLGFLGIAAYFSSNRAFEMLSVSNQYFQAAAADKPIYLAVGQSLIESWRGTAFDIYYVLNGLTLLIISFVMLRSNIFTRRISIFGLAAGILMVIPSTAGTVGMVFSLLSLIPWEIFIIMSGRQFLRFAKEG